MIALLSTVQGLPDDERATVERALVPFARTAAIGALAADIAHDVGNSLFGLTGLLDLVTAGEPIDAERLALLLKTAGELDAAFTPLLRFSRGGDDDRASTDLAAATREAVGLYRHGERKHRELAEVYTETASRVACPPSLAVQAVVHLLLAADPAERVELADGAVRVAPARQDSLHELVGRRIAVDHGGSLDRESDALVLRLPPT